jgi:hypothetical protein
MVVRVHVLDDALLGRSLLGLWRRHFADLADETGFRCRCLSLVMDVDTLQGALLMSRVTSDEAAGPITERLPRSTRDAREDLHLYGNFNAR